MKTNRARPIALRERESWYRITNRAEAADVMLYDEIGLFGVTASDFVRELKAIKGDHINLHINSPGGEVFDAVAIYNALASHSARVSVTVDGIAASSASFIAMAGDDVRMTRNAQMMIHEAHAIGVGNAKDMRALAGLLDKCSDNIADIYAQRAGGTVAQWRARMAGETWFSAQEAVDVGLADEVIGSASRSAPKASWDLSMFRFPGRDAAPDPAIGVTEDAPVPVALAEPEPEPDPPPDTPADSPPDEAGFFVPDFTDTIRALHEVRIDLGRFRAAVEIGMNDMPAPDPPATAEPVTEEPVFTYLPAVRRALREATL